MKLKLGDVSQLLVQIRSVAINSPSNKQEYGIRQLLEKKIVVFLCLHYASRAIDISIIMMGQTE